ncbi:6-carboxytetrahydropterin synthase QueD [Candidatus Latescibacterota bacterium]
MFELCVDSHFAAAHSLRGYKGDCARLHGHTWGVTACICAESADEMGISIDFKDVSKALEEISGIFDHQTLNDLKEFSIINPTAENIAKHIYDRLSEKLNSENVTVLSVTVAESDKYRVTYRENS